jgi:hypothetical protein
MTHETMSPAILAAALELSRIHGVPYAAFFLLDRDVAFEVIAELLFDTPRQYEAPPQQACEDNRQMFRRTF